MNNGGHAGRQRHGRRHVSIGGMLAPGNSIGTLTVNGSFTPAAHLPVEVDAAGNADRINVTGPLATISGGTVDVLAAPALTAAARPTPSSMRPAATPAPSRASPATSPSLRHR